MKQGHITTLFLLPWILCAPARGDDLDDAFGKLVQGREYLAKFPDAKTRQKLVQEFVGGGGMTAKAPFLAEAVDRAIEIRRGEPPDPEVITLGNRALIAREIAWQALEANTTGYLYAGNADLLKGTRVSYPGTEMKVDERNMPVEEPDTFAGTSQKQLGYARLYFLQGMKDVLSYMARDRVGAVRAVGEKFALPHYVPFDEEHSDLMPFKPDIPGEKRWDDKHFGGAGGNEDKEASQTLAFSYGSAMERLGLASVAYADQLWRSAYAGAGAKLKRTPDEKAKMLGRAATILKENIHAQFLAALPLAAQLDDGKSGTLNSFQIAKIEQARVSVTGAQRLREQILAGEKPTQLALISSWDPAAIRRQIQRCKDTYEAARTKWGNSSDPATVKGALQYKDTSEEKNVDRGIQIRQQFESRLLDLTGFDPGKFDSLKTEQQRQAYLKAVQDKFDELINKEDTEAQGLADGNQMNIQALRLIQALKEIRAAVARVNSYSGKMNIELERNGDINATLMINSAIFSAIELAIGAAQAAPEIEVHNQGLATGVTMKVNTSAVPTAIQAALRVMRTATETVTINSLNSDAVIKNLLIEQQTAAESLPAIKLSADIAGSELRRLFNEAKRTVEDHIFFQEATDTLWYRDPTLAFKLEKPEEEYRDLIQEYRIELYKLARMIEASWCERFVNPMTRANQSTIEPVDNGASDGFTEAESVFGVANHDEGELFRAALAAWDIKLRRVEYRGEYQYDSPQPVYQDASFISGQPISLRRDIFKLPDYRYNPDENRFEADDVLSKQSIEKFRAILLESSKRDRFNKDGLLRLRVDFPLTYKQDRLIEGLAEPLPIIRRSNFGGFDQYWNHRIKRIGVKIRGRNVFAGGTTVPVSFELFGNVDRIGFFPDSLFTKSRSITTFQTPLYQRDPDLRLVEEPFFGRSSIEAAIGDTKPEMYDVSGWPLFCDNIVLRVDSQGTLRVENIEDIELTIKMEVGAPPPIVW